MTDPARTHQQDFTVAPDAVEMGAAHKVLSTIARAVHSFNRTSGEEGRYLVLDLPGYDAAKIGVPRLGDTLRVIGTPDNLEALALDERVRSAVVSGKAFADVIRRADDGPGHVLVRVRTGEKGTAAGLARSRARFERRAAFHEKGWQERKHRGAAIPGPLSDTAFFEFDPRSPRRITFRRAPCPVSPSFSTYGMIGSGGG